MNTHLVWFGLVSGWRNGLDNINYNSIMIYATPKKIQDQIATCMQARVANKGG